MTHVELLMSRIIREANSPIETLLHSLGSRTRERINTKWERLRRSGLAIDYVSAMQFGDKAKALAQLALPVDGGSMHAELVEIEQLRHLVAHAGDYALTRVTARATAMRARLAQKWVHRLSGMAAAPSRSSQIKGTASAGGS